MSRSLQNWLPEKPSRIAVGMSGGVDSSSVAYLLKEAGHEVVGLTAWTLNGPGTCCNDALVNAGRVCEDLGCEFDTVDLRAEFSHYVMDYYNRSYEAGVTPNPCVECNRYVKWEKLVDYAVKELGVDYVATGHYINLGRPQGTDGAFQILRARDSKKDQTYMLAQVQAQDLDKALFPLGMWTKPEVVDYAKSKGISSAHSKESMDVCFVLDGQANYLKQALGVKKGPIIDIDTDKVVGEHEGHFLFTRGQRKGVGVAAGRPIYVIKTDASSNTVYIGDKTHLECQSFIAYDANWLEANLSFPLRCQIKFRYNTPPKLGWVTPLESSEDSPYKSAYQVHFDEPVSAVTPAQIAAFYDETDTQLLGGAYIEGHLLHSKFQPEAIELPDLTCSVT